MRFGPFGDAQAPRGEADPDGRRRSHITAHSGTPGTTEASAPYGPPEWIVGELDALRAVGVHRVLLLAAVPVAENLRRFFAAEIMPAFG